MAKAVPRMKNMKNLWKHPWGGLAIRGAKSRIQNLTH